MMSEPLPLAADTLDDFLFKMRLLAMPIISFNLNYGLPLTEYSMAALRSTFIKLIKLSFHSINVRNVKCANDDLSLTEYSIVALRNI